MKILVTGGAGYIGSTLVPMLLDKGYQVTVFDKMNWGVHSLLSVASNKNLTIIKGDVRDRDHVENVISDKDAIIHLAAIVGGPACDKEPVVAEETNVNGTRNIAELKNKGQIFVYASTSSCYGAIDDLCMEEAMFSPHTRYAKTKADAEELVIEAGGIALRLSTVFGVSPRQRLDLLLNEMTYDAVVKQKITIFQGWYRRTVLHVKDAARALILALENSKCMSGQAYNVGDASMNMQKIELARLVRGLIPDCSIDEVDTCSDEDSRDYDLAYKKIEKMGFRPEVKIEDGIKELAKLFPLLNIGKVIQYKNVYD